MTTGSLEPMILNRRKIMSNESLKKAFDIITNAENADFDGKKGESVIEKAEKALEITFPLTYREFLLTLGCGDINGVEFYGVSTDNFETSSIPNGIWLTLDERKTCNLDKKFILLSDSLEYYYALDTSKMKDGECPVVDLLPDGTIASVVAPTFGDFLYKRIIGEISI